MSQAITRLLSPEEHEYQRYLAEIGIRKGRLAQLQVELAAYMEELGRFNAEYHARVGVLFVELDRIELQIKEYEFRIARLRAHPEIDPDDLERQTKQQFTQKREQIHNDEEETRYYERAHREEQERPELDEASQASLKDLYREMVKRFHPDLAKTEDERLQREEEMKEVNAAFHDRDFERLRRIAAQQDIDNKAFEAKSIGEKLVWAIQEISRLDGLILAAQSEIDELTRSELASLLKRQQTDEHVIDHLVQDATRRLNNRSVYLNEIVIEYQGLIHEAMYG